MPSLTERRLLQIVVAVIGLFPVVAGFTGLVGGLGVIGDADSRWRYLSGLELGLGAALWASIPNIEQKGDLFRMLTMIVVVGGLARLGAAFAHRPSNLVNYAIAFELVIVPLVAIWRERIERMDLARPPGYRGAWE